MPKNKRRKTKSLPFGYRLVLNQWIVSLLGFDPLRDHRDGKRSLIPIKPIAEAVKKSRQGLTPDNLHHYYMALAAHLPETARIKPTDLLRYEQNIASHTLAINENRSQPIIWKYYQWLSLLFAEIYLERFFADKDALLEDINRYVDRADKYWQEQGFDLGVSPYTEEELNKLCLQNATGSGKTLLMHVNFLQFRDYAGKSALKHDLTRTILITPNEALSQQHKEELSNSDITAERLMADKSDLLSTGENGLRQIDFTEITKLGDEDGVKTIAVRNVGSQNLLLVDEAHRGMSSQQERGWFSNRERLSEKGFVFEYSATFKEAVKAVKDEDIETAYAKSILFDYSYRYFYEDGYGKDYRIFNLSKTFNKLRFSYLTACLLSFYQQLRLYEEKKIEYAAYNIEKPLWVFVGSSVTKATGTKDEKVTVSDVGAIISFLAQFLKNPSATAETIEDVLTKDAKQTGLLDKNDGDIFADSFLHLQQLMREEGWKAADILQDIFKKLFQSDSGGQLLIARIRGDENEIMLRVGQAEKPFGLINVGDATGLVAHIEAQGFNNVNVQDSQFSDPLFGQLSQSSSPVNLLIGSKRFVEGWDCYRVSTLGLMHVGKKEGAQIIQLFGRGVRLRGRDRSLQRSGFTTQTERPEYIEYVETLNVFGIEADFMERFQKFLEQEELPSNEQKHVVSVPLEVTYDFGQRLKVLRPREKRGDGREYDFKRDGRVPSLGDTPPKKFHANKIQIDWYPRIQSLESRSRYQSDEKNESQFSMGHLDLLNYGDLFLRLEEFKQERAWFNINIDMVKIRELLEDKSWYQLIVPAAKMELANFSNVELWQEMAYELLQKYIEEYYNYSKAAFSEPRLEFRKLKQDDGNLPETETYRIMVDANEDALIADIKALKKRIADREGGVLDVGDLKACRFGNHLYEPVFHVTKGSAIKVAPVYLNESEFQFLNDLRKYLEAEQERLEQEGTKFFLLRNESRRRGIGFFEAGNFYPDFLLWQVKGKIQYLSFIEPHGLQHTGTGDKKIVFHKVIKDIQARLNDPNVILNSFIVTPSRYQKLNWGESPGELEDMHVLFMQDESYIEKIAEKMLV